MAGSLLVHGGCVVTMDAARTRFDDGFVLARDGVIEAVGPAAEMPDPATVDERLDASGCIVAPGLVNTHQHHWYDLFKTLGGGMLLEQWIQNLLVPTARAVTADDLAAAARLAGLEMVGTGTTTFLNHSVTETGEEEVEATVRPLLEAGMRQVFDKEVRPDPLEDQLALARAVHERWDGAGGGLVRIGLVVETTAHWVALGTCSEELVVRGHELAGELGARISTHVAGGTMTRDQGYLKFVLQMGRTDIEFLQQLGVLDERWLLAHAIYLRDRDVELVAASGATISHTPTSESARGADARHVIVDGEPLLRDGAFTRHDDDAVREIVAEARARAAELLDRTDVPAHRQAATRGALPAIV
jgi:5-methylthioadenosine/S-adenosylhomocysteine deaminase